MLSNYAQEISNKCRSLMRMAAWASSRSCLDQSELACRTSGWIGFVYVRVGFCAGLSHFIRGWKYQDFVRHTVSFQSLTSRHGAKILTAEYADRAKRKKSRIQRAIRAGCGSY